MTQRSGTTRTLILATAVLIAAIALIRATSSNAVEQSTLVRGNAPGEWRYWGADAWSTRYSPLDQVNASNFNTLQVAWRWNASEFGEDEYYRTTPLYANGRLFTVATSRRYAFAVDPATGRTLWSWKDLDEGIRWQKAPRRFAGRGLAYWTDGRNERVIVVTPGYHLAALDAKTGKPDPAFGRNGIVDLQDGLGFPLVPLAVDDSGALIISEAAPLRKAHPGETWDPVKKIGADGSVGIDPAQGQIAASSPPIVVNDVIVVGNSAMHGYYPIRLHNLPGYIRGFDVRTGKQLWKFNLVPQPGEFGANTWEKGSKIGSEGVGKNDAWAPYSADPELGLVYIPVGMPLSDEYGGHRPGDNLFGNSIVAIDVKTGQRKWHFQMVHHDIWDYDTPMAPNLLDVTVNGQRRRIIAVTTKQGWVYVFDRVTGRPIWPMPETPVLQSEVPGEKTSRTQPIPSRPAPYAQQGLVEADLIDYTPAIKDSALKVARRCRMGPYFIPPSPADGRGANGRAQYECSWYAPGASGGVNIDGGAAADPETGMLYVGGQSGLSMIEVAKDPCSEHRYSQAPHDSCGLLGALPPPPGYTPGEGRGGRRGGTAGGGGARGGGARGGGDARGGDARGGAARGGAAVGAGQAAAGGLPACAGGGGGRGGNAAIGGISILKPKQLGGVTAYNLNNGDKVWWIPNGGVLCVPQTSDALFAGVTLPPQASGGGQAQVMTTKTLVIYGTGRNGGGATPQLFAQDKATGKPVGVINIPSKTSAVPMTFMHQGKQYIVFATGSGMSTALIALTLR
jgi:outer membrane protein assembly factor BamB